MKGAWNQVSSPGHQKFTTRSSVMWDSGPDSINRAEKLTFSIITRPASINMGGPRRLIMKW